MKKIFCVILSVAIAVSLFGFTGTGSAATRTFRLGHQAPEDNVVHIAGLKFAELLEEKSGGRMRVDVFPNGQLGFDFELLQALQFGTIDFASVTNSPVSNFVPNFGVIDLPYLMHDWSELRVFVQSEPAKRLLAECTDRGLRAFGFYPIGFRGVTNSIRPIRTPEDLRGLRMRVIESTAFIRTFEDFGTVPTAMSWGEVFTALQQGTIDGQENHPIAIHSSRVFDVQNYYSLTRHMATFHVLMGSEAVVSALPEADQQIIQEAALETLDYIIDFAMRIDDELLSDLNDNLGLAVNEVDDISAFAALATSADRWFIETHGDEYVIAIRGLFGR